MATHFDPGIQLPGIFTKKVIMTGSKMAKPDFFQNEHG